MWSIPNTGKAPLTLLRGIPASSVSSGAARGSSGPYYQGLSMHFPLSFPLHLPGAPDRAREQALRDAANDPKEIRRRALFEEIKAEQAAVSDSEDVNP